VVESKQEINKWTTFEKAWFITALAIITATVYFRSNGLLSDIAAICGIIYVILIAKQNKIAYLFGIVNALAYGFILYKDQIYGGAVYNIVYSFPMFIYGFFYWKKKEKAEDLGIKNLHTKTRIVLGSIFTITILIMAAILNILGGKLVIIDSIITISGYVAIYLTVNKYMEQWFLWIMSNLAGVIMWGIFTCGDINKIELLVMWTIYLLNSIYGYFNWNKINANLKRKIVDNNYSTD
jgi:nicotinamide mononucleotide transporter